MNRSESAARMLLFSSSRSPAVAVYPDSDKVGVYVDGADDLIFKRGTAVPWSEGEEGWQNAT
jgi:acetyl/propionyl-CoA carboxylase alpha subunit